MEFIEPTKVAPFAQLAIGRRIACIGAGNTAIDVVTAAKRLGAETVHLIYRRGEQDMPAFRYEYDLAKLDGVNFHWHAQPVRILGDAAAKSPQSNVFARASNPAPTQVKSAATLPAFPAANSSSMWTWSSARSARNR